MIWKLLILFQLKHFIADYLLQGKYMLGKFKEKGWVEPLAAHCAVQATFTYFITLYTLEEKNIAFFVAIGLAAFDFIIHFIMDRIKASPKWLGRFKALSGKEMLMINTIEKDCKNMIQSMSLEKAAAARDTVSLCEERLIGINKELKSNTYFWWALGFDQMVHHLTDIAIIYFLVGYL